MKYILLLLTIFSLSSCSEKIVQLPETTNKDITEVLDVSPVYLFYLEEKDSVEFNRKNVISTTNWLVNVDKRLTLKQAMPHIIYLQNKRKKAGMHKNAAARNYFSCSNPDIKNLAFIDFTDIVYKTYKDEDGFLRDSNSYNLDIVIKSEDSVLINPHFHPKTQTNNNLIKKLNSEIEYVKTFSDDPEHGFQNISLNFSYNRSLSFQEYINIKSLFKGFETEGVMISNNEFIY